jgi:hypothetical protein
MLERVLFWSPRLLALLFAGFLSLFAFGAVTEGHGLRASTIHFVMSLLPTLVVLLSLAIAWRWEWVGASLFLGLAVAYVGVSWGRFPLSTYLVIAGPMILVALLFLAHWRYPVGPARELAQRRAGVVSSEECSRSNSALTGRFP